MQKNQFHEVISRNPRPKRYLVKTTILANGERAPGLYHEAPFQPVVPVLLYIGLHRRYQRTRTILRDVRVLAWFFGWWDEFKSRRENLEELLSHGGIPSVTDLEEFARWLRLGADSRRSFRNVVIGWPHILRPSTLENYMAALKGFFCWTIDRYAGRRRCRSGWLADKLVRLESSFSSIKIRGKTPELEKGLTNVEIEQLFKAISPNNPANPFRLRLRRRNALMVNLLLQTGLRRGELLKLKGEDLVEDDEGRFYVAVVRRPDDPTDTRVVEPGQKTYSRLLAIHSDLYKVLINYVRQERRPHRTGKPMKLAHSFLFTSERGHPLAEAQVNHILRRAEKAAFGPEGPRIHPHILRNTFCNDFIDFCVEDEGLDEEAAKDRLRALCGWSPGSEMPERYTKKRIRREANRLNLLRISASRDAK